MGIKHIYIYIYREREILLEACALEPRVDALRAVAADDVEELLRGGDLDLSMVALSVSTVFRFPFLPFRRFGTKLVLLRFPLFVLPFSPTPHFVNSVFRFGDRAKIWTPASFSCTRERSRVFQSGRTIARTRRSDSCISCCIML